MLEKIKSFLWHPITGIAIGIIVAVVIYYAERKMVEPLYAVSDPKLIAEVTADTPELKLLWEEEEIINAYIIEIAIWNGGRAFIDNDLISTTKPIRVTIPEGVEVLSASFTKFSRVDLVLNALQEEQEHDHIYIEIIGDEALENKDGGVLQILFTGNKTDDFKVVGRIKGSKEGFKKEEWAEVVGINFSWNTLILILVIFLGLNEFIKFITKVIEKEKRLVDRPLWSKILLVFLILIQISVIAFYFSVPLDIFQKLFLNKIPCI